jgi:antirestriction protein ArdC
VDGIEAKIPASGPVKTFNPIEACEAVWDGYKGRPTLINGNGRAFYRPATDQIGMPAKTDFDSETAYYSTLFHEATHSTGAESRLAREFGDRFGDEKYSKEEMVAEMGAAFLNAHCGIENQIDSSQAYLAHWLEVIKADPKMLVSAASKAEKAADFILGDSPTAPVTNTSDETEEAPVDETVMV